MMSIYQETFINIMESFKNKNTREPNTQLHVKLYVVDLKSEMKLHHQELLRKIIIKNFKRNKNQIIGSMKFRKSFISKTTYS